MSTVTLTRFAYTPVGTFGTITYKDFTAYTVERPWLDNAPMISCIPDGDYKLQWYNSPRFGRTVAVIGGTVSLFPSNQHKRSAILVHAANTMDDLQGCIGLGRSLGYVSNKWAVTVSRLAVDDFLALLRSDDNIDFRIKQIHGAN